MKRIIGTIAASVLLLAVAAGPALACPPGEDDEQGTRDHRICKVTDLGLADAREVVKIVASSTDDVQGGDLVVTIERAATGINSQHKAPRTVVSTNVTAERSFFVEVPNWRNGAIIRAFITDGSRAKTGCETVAVDVLT